MQQFHRFGRDALPGVINVQAASFEKERGGPVLVLEQFPEVRSFHLVRVFLEALPFLRRRYELIVAHDELGKEVGYGIIAIIGGIGGLVHEIVDCSFVLGNQFSRC